MNRLMSTVASTPEQAGFGAEAEGPGPLVQGDKSIGFHESQGPTGAQMSWLFLSEEHCWFGCSERNPLSSRASDHIYAASCIFLGHPSTSNSCSLGFLVWLSLFCASESQGQGAIYAQCRCNVPAGNTVVLCHHLFHIHLG